MFITLIFKGNSKQTPVISLITGLDMMYLVTETGLLVFEGTTSTHAIFHL